MNGSTNQTDANGASKQTKKQTSKPRTSAKPEHTHTLEGQTLWSACRLLFFSATRQQAENLQRQGAQLPRRASERLGSRHMNGGLLSQKWACLKLGECTRSLFSFWFPFKTNRGPRNGSPGSCPLALYPPVTHHGSNEHFTMLPDVLVSQCHVPHLKCEVDDNKCVRKWPHDGIQGFHVLELTSVEAGRCHKCAPPSRIDPIL